MSIKTLLAVAAASAFSAPVLAGPYVGLDTKTKFTGSDYSSTEFTGKIGYSGKVGTSKYFVEGGPITTAADGSDTETEFFVASGLGFALSDSVGAKASIKYESNDGGDNKYEFKTGLKYSF
jgi:hypothetical protein|tara:strand:- start:153 stop:515 length:363 start_codon:yes stop_codon:yes gene_type:complete